jgi:hypothetical protein
VPGASEGSIWLCTNAASILRSRGQGRPSGAADGGAWPAQAVLGVPGAARGPLTRPPTSLSVEYRAAPAAFKPRCGAPRKGVCHTPLRPRLRVAKPAQAGWRSGEGAPARRPGGRMQCAPTPRLLGFASSLRVLATQPADPGAPQRFAPSAWSVQRGRDAAPCAAAGRGEACLAPTC